jgi:lysophospholipase L1-like esterase
MLTNVGLRLRVVLVAVVAACALALTIAGEGAPVAAGPGPDHPYLALGDSVVFGFITQAGFEYRNPDNFVGYPAYVGRALRLDAINASCPGEATTGFISATGADNGCRPYKANFPLHTSYSGTQLDFATAFLSAHRNTRLVSIGLGANDAFLLQEGCKNDPACIAAGLPAVLNTVSTDMDAIFKALEATRFHGVLVVLNYYSLDYSDAAGTGLTELLNNAITAHASADGAVVADVFTAFKNAASNAGGKTCDEGLLNASPQNQLTCDVHTSQSGQEVIAATVEQAFESAH